jgi:hypothetical protein
MLAILEQCNVGRVKEDDTSTSLPELMVPLSKKSRSFSATEYVFRSYLALPARERQENEWKSALFVVPRVPCQLAAWSLPDL